MHWQIAILIDTTNMSLAIGWPKLVTNIPDWHLELYIGIFTWIIQTLYPYLLVIIQSHFHIFIRMKNRKIGAIEYIR